MLLGIAFDIATLLLAFVLVILLMNRKNYPTLSTNSFVRVLAFNALLAVFDILAGLANYSASAALSSFNLFSHLLIPLGVGLVGAGYLQYAYAVTQTPKKKIEVIVVIAILVIDVIGILSNIPLRLVYIIDINQQIQYRLVYYVLLVVNYVLFARTALVFLQAKEHMKSYTGSAVCLNLAFVTILYLLDAVSPNISIFAFGMMLVLLFTFVTLQSPVDYMVKNSTCFNDHAFYSTCARYASKKESFSVIGIAFDDLDYLLQNHSKETIEYALMPFIEYGMNRFGRMDFYYLGDLHIALVSKKNKGELANSINEVITYFKNPVVIEKDEYLLSPYFIDMRYPDFYTDLEDFIGSVNYVFNHPELKDKSKVVNVTRQLMNRRYYEIEILHAIHRALTEHNFRIYYQPIYRQVDGHFVSAEALIRLEDPNLGFVSPDDFVQVAEQNNMMNEIGKYVINQVCEDFKNLKFTDIGIKFVEVNLSMDQCVDEDLPNIIKEALNKNHLKPEQINFEVTETSSAHNYEKELQNTLSKIKEMGHSLSLDDYGTGYSTAMYLITMPFDIVKIDKSLLWSALDDPYSMAILKHTVSMMKDLKKQIVVEGVETAKQADLLRKLGVDYFQGYLYSKAITKEEFVEYIKTHNHIQA